VSLINCENCELSWHVVEECFSLQGGTEKVVQKKPKKIYIIIAFFNQSLFDQSKDKAYLYSANILNKNMTSFCQPQNAML